MTDVVDPATRSRMMSGIRGKNTRPELRVRSLLHAAGLRYRLHGAGLPGRPDLVFSRARVAVFVHGCFWHRHGCFLTATPSTRPAFWTRKFGENMARDANACDQLMNQGWRVCVIWECALKGPAQLNDEEIQALFIDWYRSGDSPMLEIPFRPPSTTPLRARQGVGRMKA